MEALRDLADNFNVRDPRKLYQLARQRNLDATQAMTFKALKAEPGGRRSTAGGDGRRGRRGTSAEQERQDGGPRHQAHRAEADGGRRELCGHNRPGQQVCHAGEAVHRTKRPKDATPLPWWTGASRRSTRVARKGGQWSDHFKRAAGAYNARPHETVQGPPRQRRLPSADKRGEKLQPLVRQRAAVGRGSAARRGLLSWRRRAAATRRAG